MSLILIFQISTSIHLGILVYPRLAFLSRFLGPLARLALAGKLHLTGHIRLKSYCRAGKSFWANKSASSYSNRVSGIAPKKTWAPSLPPIRLEYVCFLGNRSSSEACEHRTEEPSQRLPQKFGVILRNCPL